MNLLNWFFNKITPTGKNTWLSIKYNRWLNEKFVKENKFFEKYDYKRHTFFSVPGAGLIAIGNSPTSSTGGAKGFDFSVSWSRHGLNFGGVLDIFEAKRLANFILGKIEISQIKEFGIIDSIDTVKTEKIKLEQKIQFLISDFLEKNSNIDLDILIEKKTDLMGSCRTPISNYLVKISINI